MQAQGSAYILTWSDLTFGNKDSLYKAMHDHNLGNTALKAEGPGSPGPVRTVTADKVSLASKQHD